MAQATRDTAYGTTGTTGTTSTTGYGSTGTTGTTGLGGSAPTSNTRTTTGPGGETYVTTTVTEAVNTGPSTAAVAATCDRQYYTTTEDRQRVLEQRELIREHHPFEKEFVVETKPTGRERALERPQSEVIDFKTRIVERVQPALCEGAPVISATGVHTRGQLTGEGITTIESARGTTGTTGTGIGTGSGIGTGTGSGLTGGGAGYTSSGTSTGIGAGSRATTGTSGYGGSSTGTGAGTTGYGSTTGTGTTGTGRNF